MSCLLLEQRGTVLAHVQGILKNVGYYEFFVAEKELVTNLCKLS